MAKLSVKEYFLAQLKSKNSTVSKEDIINLALECNMQVKAKMAKVKIIDMLLDNGYYNRLFEYFQEFITIPEWNVADYYNMSTNKIHQLREIGAIKEDPVDKEFYSRSNHDYFYAATYPLSILNYSRDELIKAYENAFDGSLYNLRIETKTKEEVFELIEVLDKVFKMQKAPATYEHRNSDGYYSYFRVKLLNGSKEEENLLLSKISRLKEAQEKIKKEYEEEINNIFMILQTYLGDNLDKFNLESRLSKLFDNKEVNKLISIPINNERNAGRKPKFNDTRITEMEIMKENGYSYSEIAKEYNTTKTTVIKYLKLKNSFKK